MSTPRTYRPTHSDPPELARRRALAREAVTYAATRPYVDEVDYMNTAAIVGEFDDCPAETMARSIQRGREQTAAARREADDAVVVIVALFLAVAQDAVAGGPDDGGLRGVTAHALTPRLSDAMGVAG